MSTDTEKRTVEDILEYHLPGEISDALAINDIKVAAANFADSFSDPNKSARVVMWDVVDHCGVPREFIELCVKIADFEVRL